MIKCPYCGGEESTVVDSRRTGHETYQEGYVRRRRECDICGKRYSTYEITQQDFVLVKDVLDMLRKAGYEKVLNGK